jgi:hypothetical protein
MNGLCWCYSTNTALTQPAGRPQSQTASRASAILAQPGYVVNLAANRLASGQRLAAFVL